MVVRQLLNSPRGVAPNRALRYDDDVAEAFTREIAECPHTPNRKHPAEEQLQWSYS